jgi:hypothetical protein
MIVREAEEEAFANRPTDQYDFSRFGQALA